MGLRRIISCEEVRVLHIPQYEGLSIADLLEYASEFPDVMRALPSEAREVKKLPRQYLANVVSVQLVTDSKSFS